MPPYPLTQTSRGLAESAFNALQFLFKFKYPLILGKTHTRCGIRRYIHGRETAEIAGAAPSKLAPRASHRSRKAEYSVLDVDPHDPLELEEGTAMKELIISFLSSSIGCGVMAYAA